MKQNEKIERFKTFAEFWPYYLSEHRNKTNRNLHVIGTSIVLMLLVLTLVSQNYTLLWLLPLVGYSFAWFGHFYFEKNKPATFRYPIWSLYADFKMLYQTYRSHFKS